MNDLAVTKRLFENVVRFLECLLQISAPDVRAESDVGAGYSLQVFQVGERRGWSERVVNDRSTGLCCGDHGTLLMPARSLSASSLVSFAGGVASEIAAACSEPSLFGIG